MEEEKNYITPEGAELVAHVEASTEATEPEVVVTPTEEPVAEKKVYTTKAEVLERLREVAHGEEAPVKEEIDLLKTLFYKFHLAEREVQLQAFKDGGGLVENFVPVADEDEDAFKAEMVIIKEKRARLQREQEAERESNLARKEAILERLKAMLTSPEEANKSYAEFKALCNEWKEIRNVPQARVRELWNNYSLYVDQYYDLLKLNNEAREYDLKKNLEAKTKLIEEAEKLAEETDIVKAARQLQKLHDEYREIGPVARDIREALWTRFKEASSVVNKRHQQHFEALRAREKEAAEAKTALCEHVEAIVAEENKGRADWDRHSKAIIELQKEWKAAPFASPKLNTKLYERFRAACDDFFTRKAEFFREVKSTFKDNVERKRALIARANELKDSTEWQTTAEALIALQKEWRTIGFTSKKLNDALWEEFIGACNHFFDARKAANGERRNGQRSRGRERNDEPTTERARLQRQYDTIKNELQTYENNIGFLSTSSKKGNSLIDSLNKKVEKLRADLAAVRDKIDDLDD